MLKGILLVAPMSMSDFLAVYFKGGNIGKSVGVITNK